MELMMDIALTIKRNYSQLIKKVVRDLICMTSIKPVVVNLIAVLLAVALFYFISETEVIPKNSTAILFCKHIVELLIIIQLFKSATKSLFFPILITSITALLVLAIHIFPEYHLLSHETIRNLIIISAIALGISILKIN